MQSYKNMIFCPFYEECLLGQDCGRRLTEEVKNAAINWWGNDDAPITLYLDKPGCFEEED